jgi:hypothetical protein
MTSAASGGGLSFASAIVSDGSIRSYPLAARAGSLVLAGAELEMVPVDGSSASSRPVTTKERSSCWC